MDETKKVFMHLDILGFDEQAKQIEEIHKIPSWKARRNVANKVGEIIESHLKENKCKRTSLDSWMFLFEDTNSALEYAKNIQKSMEERYNLISLEIGITCEGVDIGCDEFWYTDAAMLAAKICGKYRNAYKQNYNESIKNSFAVIHESTYKEIEKTVKDSLSHDLKYEKINNEVVYSYNPRLYTPPSFISTIKSKKEEEKVEKKVEEHQTITLYDPAHMEDLFMECEELGIKRVYETRRDWEQAFRMNISNLKIKEVKRIAISHALVKGIGNEPIKKLLEKGCKFQFIILNPNPIDSKANFLEQRAKQEPNTDLKGESEGFIKWVEATFSDYKGQIELWVYNLMPTMALTIIDDNLLYVNPYLLRGRNQEAPVIEIQGGSLFDLYKGEYEKVLKHEDTEHIFP